MTTIRVGNQYTRFQEAGSVEGALRIAQQLMTEMGCFPMQFSIPTHPSIEPYVINSQQELSGVKTWFRQAMK